MNKELEIIANGLNERESYLLEHQNYIKNNILTLNNFELLHEYAEAVKRRRYYVFGNSENPLCTKRAQDIVFETYDIIMHEALRRMGEFD